MTSKKLLAAYQRYLKENTDPKRAIQEKRYLYSELKHYGLSVPKIDAFQKLHQKGLASLSKKKAISLVKTLWRVPSHEERSLALRILQLHKDKLTISDMPFVEKLMRESRGWAFLDELIIPVMPVILEKDRNAFSYLTTWIKDNDFWVRRSALLAQLLFFRKGDGGNRKLFFKMAKSQFDEGWIDKIYKNTETKKRARFFIRKAIGWSLREMSAKNPGAVFEFLRDNKEQMSGLTFREASKKLSSR